MMVRRSLLLLVILAAAGGVARAAELQGKVAGVIGKDVRIALEGDLLPQPGDEVTIRFEIPGGPMVVVGRWRVTSIDGDSVVAALVDATGTPAVGQHATIVSANPVPRAPKQKVLPPPPSGDHVAIRFQGQVIETLYQHQIVDGRGLDIYFYKALDAGPDTNGGPLFNRFVRDPSENERGEFAWWSCRWVVSNGERTYQQTKVAPEEVTVVRTAVNSAAYEGSVWKATSTETSGDRKGQSFSFEATMTTRDGVTRLTSPTTYAEGKIVADRFTFSTYASDGSGPIGQGFCVISGNVFSGGWTATNGRAGTWEARRIR